MTELLLRSGPVLLHRPHDGRSDAERSVVTDVTERAVEFIFEPVELAQHLTVSDVFKLLDRCPELRRLFRRDFAEELCAEARKGPLPQSGGDDPVEFGGIEYLELYRCWAFDSSKRAYSSTLRLNLDGVGPILAADAPTCGAKAGERINWSVSLTPLRELLNLPLRYRERFSITEDDIDARAYGGAVAEAVCPEVSLGQVIHGLLYELSFHGAPAEQAEFRDELSRRKAEVDSGRAKLIPADDLFAEFHGSAVAALFDATGDVAAAEIARAVRGLADDAPASAQLEQLFADRVKVKPQFRNRGGREFRKAFRAARR